MALTNHELHALIFEKFPPARLSYRISSDSWELDGEPVSTSSLNKKIRMALDLKGAERVDLCIYHESDSRISAAQIKTRNWLASLESQPVDQQPLRSWLNSMERETTTPMTHEANVVAMRQFIWQVKRNIERREVQWHTVPIFWSTEGGTGKSYNLRRILAPVDQYMRNLSVNDLGAKFSGRLFAQTLVAFLDEFAGADKACAASLKAIITGKPIDERAIFSESGFYAQNRMSCLGTSNIAPPHDFIDHTGARRFWSIHCGGKSMKGDSEKMTFLDNFDVNSLWRCVSVDEESPEKRAPRQVISFMDSVRDENLRTKTSLELFCAECLVPSDGARISIQDFISRYKEYCSLTRQPQVRADYKKVCALIKEVGYKSVAPGNRRFVLDHDFVDFTEAFETPSSRVLALERRRRPNMSEVNFS